METKQQTRIFWTADEKRTLAETSFELRNSKMFQGSDLQCVLEAMRECLPPHKHRPINTMSMVEWIRDMWKELMQAKLASRSEPVIKPMHVPRVEAESRAVVNVLADVPFEALWAELGRRMSEISNPTNIRSIARAETNATIDRRLPGLVPADIGENQPETKQRAIMRKVCVIGLMNAQKEMLKQQYKDSVNFHFIEGNEGKTTIKNISSTMDLTIRSKWCKGHLGSTKDFEKYQATTGAMGEVRAIINRTFGIQHREIN